MEKACGNCHNRGADGTCYKWEGCMGTPDLPNWEQRTNADRVRSMSDKELRELYEKIGGQTNKEWFDWLRKPEEKCERR